MADTYTADGKRVVYFDPERLAEAFANGSVGFKPGKKIVVYKPDAPNEVFDMPSENAMSAIEDGYLFETDLMATSREYLKENDGFIGAAKVAAYEFANSVAMGVPDIVNRNTGDQDEWARFGALREEQEMAAMVGAGLGIGANVYGMAKSGALAATELMAKRIMATIPGLTKAAATKHASTILGRLASKTKNAFGVVTRNTAQGAIEGALDMAVPASAEALFGNYEEAAETMLLGAGFGGVLGGGVRSVASTVTAGKKAMREMTSGDHSMVEDLGLKGAANFLNRDAEALRYVKNNLDDVENAVPRRKNYDDLNSVKQAEELKYSDAKTEIKGLEDQIEAKRNSLNTEMLEKSKEPDAIVAKHLEDEVKRSQAWLMKQTELREQILVDEMGDPVILKTVFTEPLDKAIKRMGHLTGGTDQATVNTVKALRARVGELDDLMTGKQAQEQMQSIRRDISWDPRLGFDERLNGILKDVTEGASENLKWYSDSYRESMEAMAPVAKGINALSFAVGKKPKDFAAKITKGVSNDATDAFEGFKSSVRNHEGFENIDATFEEALKDYRGAEAFRKAIGKAKDTKKAGGMNDFDKEMFPEETNLLAIKKKLFTETEADYFKLKPILSKKTDSLMKFKALDTEDFDLNDAFTFLDERHPDLGNMKRRLKNSSMKKYMEGAAPQGSRAANIYGGIGLGVGSFGGPIAAALSMAAGGVVGGHVDRFGGKAFMGVSRHMRGLLATEKQVGKLANKTNEISTVLTRMKFPDPIARESASRRVVQATNQVINQLIQSDRDRKKILEIEKQQEKDGQALIDKSSRVRAWQAVGATLAEFKNPDKLNSILGEVGGEMIEGGAPSIGMKMMDKMAKGVEYLDSVIPKDPMPKSPFKKSQWQPSDYDLRAFEEKLTVVYEPMVIFDALEAGKLTRNHTDALKNIYPGIHKKIQKKVFEAVVDDDIELDYAKRVGLGYILDTPLDVGMTAGSFAYYQSVTAGAGEQEEEAQSRPAQGSFKTKIRSKPEELQSFNSRLGSA